jgi:hypothetical protein
MEQNHTPPSPIAGEPASLKHIGYALDLMDMVIRNSHHEVDIQDLIKIQHHLINAKYAVPAHNTGRLTPVAELIEASDAIDNNEPAPSIADELEAADLEGWN